MPGFSNRGAWEGSRRKAWRIVLACLLGMLLVSAARPVPAGATPPVKLGPEVADLSLTPHLEILEDPQGALTFDQVVTPPLTGEFHPHGSGALNLPRKLAVYWLRFRLEDSTVRHRKSGGAVWFMELAESLVSEIDIYLPQGEPVPGGLGPDGNYLLTRGGDRLDSHRRDIHFRTLVFRLEPSSYSNDYVYIRIHNIFPIRAPLHLWSHDSFSRRQWSDTMSFGIFYGILAAMILYNAAMLFSLRDKVYAWYIFHVSSLLLLELFTDGQLVAAVNLGQSEALTVYWASLGGVVAGMGAFSRLFMDTKKNIPFADLLVRLLILAGVVQSVLGLVGWYGLALTLRDTVFLAGAGLFMSIGFIRLRQGYKPSRSYLVGWMGLLICGVWQAARDWGILPAQVGGLPPALIGVEWEAMWLSFALADRIRGLKEEREELAKRERRYQALSITDELTGLFNKRYLMARLKQETDRLNAGAWEALALVMMDLDNFKAFNDAFGHVEGDQVLKRLAHVMIKNLRAKDSACRYGGEEFCVILPGADLGAAGRVADRIRQGFQDEVYNPGGGLDQRMTVSLGVALWRPGEGPEDLLRRADAALYRAKSLGKNRVELEE